MLFTSDYLWVEVYICGNRSRELDLLMECTVFSNKRVYFGVIQAKINSVCDRVRGVENNDI